MDKPAVKFSLNDSSSTKTSQAPVVVVPFFKAGKGDAVKMTTNSADLLGAEKNGLLKTAKAMNFTAKKHEVVVLPAPSGVKKCDFVILLGLGEAKELGSLCLEKAGAVLTDTANKHKFTHIQIVLPTAKDGIKDITDADIAGRFATGLMLKNYRFETYKAKDSRTNAKDVLSSVDMISVDAKAADAEVKKQIAIAEGTYLVRTFVNEPPNELLPHLFAKKIEKLFAKTPVKTTLIGEKKLKAMGADLLLSVGQASTSESHLVVMEYNGTGNKKSQPLALVGKGVCFDTGGNNIKSFTGMLDMKADMGGAAVVVSTMKSLAARKAKVHVVGIVGLVENMVAGNATRPSDIVKSLSGKTVEILNTDAEGRLVLADAMWYVQDKYKPSHMIDLATLTGAIITALGGEYAGGFTNDDAMVKALEAAGKTSNEPVWNLPICKAYEKQMDSDIADVKNLGNSSLGAGSATAACFLKRFVQDGVKWTHLDIAGTTLIKGSWAHMDKGATGYGARLLNDYIAQNFEK